MVKSPAFTELSLVAQYRVPNPIVKKRAPTTCTTQPIQSNPTRQFIPCPCHHTNSRTMKQSDSTGYGILNSRLKSFGLHESKIAFDYTLSETLCSFNPLPIHKFLQISVQLFMLIYLYEDRIFITFPVIFDIS